MQEKDQKDGENQSNKNKFNAILISITYSKCSVYTLHHQDTLCHTFGIWEWSGYKQN